MVNATGSLAEIQLYGALRDRGELTVRTRTSFGAVAVNHHLTPEFLADLEKARTEYHDDWVSANLVKFFVDGGTGLVPPLTYVPADYKKLVLELDKRGYQIMTHAYRPDSTHLVVNTYEEAERANGPRDRRFRIEHGDFRPRARCSARIRTLDHYEHATEFLLRGEWLKLRSEGSDQDGPLAEPGKVWGPDRLRQRLALHLAAESVYRDSGSRDPANLEDVEWRRICRRGLRRRRPGGICCNERYVCSRRAPYRANKPWMLTRKDRPTRDSRRISLGTLEAGQGGRSGRAFSGCFLSEAGRNFGKTKVVTTMIGGKVVFEQGKN